MLDLDQNSIYYMIPICPSAMIMLQVTRYQCQLRPYIQQSLKCLGISFSPLYSYLNKWPQTLWGRTRGIITMYTCCGVTRSYLLGDPVLPSGNNLQVSKLAEVWKIQSEIVILHRGLPPSLIYFNCLSYTLLTPSVLLLILCSINHLHITGSEITFQSLLPWSISVYELSQVGFPGKQTAMKCTCRRFIGECFQE